LSSVPTVVYGCSGYGSYFQTSSTIIYAVIPTLPNGDNRSATVNITEYRNVCNEPQCAENEELVNGECVTISPQNCQSLHADDWLSHSSSTADSCGALVDGISYSNASFHDAYDNYKAVCCVLPIKPSFECSELGHNWSSRSESSESSCNALVDGVTIDSSNYITGDSVAPTCCVHLMPDNNATDSGDNNETTPPTDTNDSTPPTDTNDTAPQTDNNEDNNSTPQTLDDAIDQLRNDNNLNASNAQGKYDDLIIGLRDVKENQTQIGEVAHEDAQEIKDAISNEEEEEESENRVSEAQEGNSEILDLLDTALDGYNTGFDGLRDIFNGYSPPVVSASGSCDLSTVVFGSSVSFSDGFSRMFAIFRPFVILILNISLTFLLLRWTILVFLDIFRVSSNIFT